MTLVRRVARPLLGSVFVSGGIDALRNPQPLEPAAESVAPPVARQLPYLPEDTRQLVQIIAAVQVVAGSLLSIGRFPRLCALALACSTVPTLAGHRFWEAEDAEERKRQQAHFFQDAGLLGGLLIAAVDTEGKPSVAWRTRRAAKRASQAAHIVS